MLCRQQGHMSSWLSTVNLISTCKWSAVAFFVFMGSSKKRALTRTMLEKYGSCWLHLIHAWEVTYWCLAVFRYLWKQALGWCGLKTSFSGHNQPFAIRRLLQKLWCWAQGYHHLCYIFSVAASQREDCVTERSAILMRHGDNFTQPQ